MDPDFDQVRSGIVFSTALDSVARIRQEIELRMGTTDYFPAEVMLPCRVRFPENYDPDVPVKLLIGLHGYGANPEGFIGLWEAFEEPGFIFAVLQAPYPRYSGSVPGHSWMLWSDDEELSRATAAESYSYICSAAEALQAQYRISGTYLLGFSQGCGFALETGLLNPELFNGLIGFGGWLDTAVVSDQDILAASDLRIFLAHGTEDMVVEYEAGTAAFERLSSLGIDIEFSPFQGGHTVDRETLGKAQHWMEER